MAKDSIETIEWDDHFGSSDNTFRSRMEIMDRSKFPYIISSVGFVVHEDEKKVILAMERREDEDYGSDKPYRDYTAILKVAIRSRKKLH